MAPAAAAKGKAGEARQGRLFGRRRGRALRPGRERLIRERLPELCLTPPPPGACLDLPSLFPGRPREIWLEIGFGGGEHLAWQAARHREVGFLGAEVYVNGIASLLREVEGQALTNVRIFPEDARLLLPWLPDRSLARVFLLFPDPWPKTRHRRRRFFGEETLEALSRLLSDGGELRLATDDPGYLALMLRLLLAHRDFEWLATSARDWRERPADWPGTRYEAKARAAGRVPTFLCFRRRVRAEKP